MPGRGAGASALASPPAIGGPCTIGEPPPGVNCAAARGVAAVGGHPSARTCSIARVLDAAVLARALRAGIGLRDKVVVVQLAAAALADPAQLEAIAGNLALARALGVRLLVVGEPGPGPGPLDGPAPALRLVAALARHGATGVVLPAASLVTVHPGMPVVNAMVLVQLCSLGYVPILLLPVADAAGVVVDLAPAALAAAVARFTDAALLVVMGDAAPAGLLPTPPTVTTRAAAPGQLLADVLLYEPAPAGQR